MKKSTHSGNTARRGNAAGCGKNAASSRAKKAAGKRGGRDLRRDDAAPVGNGTRVTIYKDHNGAYLGFSIKGHAGYGAYGEDIVCAGVSALALTTVEAISRLSGERFSCDSDKEAGEITLRLEGPAGHDAALLIEALALGIGGISASYGTDHVTLEYEEV